jgi:hypothetical protein
MIARLLRSLYLHRLHLDMERKLAWRKLARSVKSEAAKRGQSTYWQRAGKRHRELWGR